MPPEKGISFMKILHLRNKILLGGATIGIVMTLTFMLAVSWVISEQYQNQSKALLTKATRIVNDNLAERRHSLLESSRRLAAQKNLGSTIWYLAQYAEADIKREMLFVTYQQLVKDTQKIGRVAKLSRVALYDGSGHLFSFILFDKNKEIVGFVEHKSAPVFHVATLNEGEELNRDNLKSMSTLAGVECELSGAKPHQEGVNYVVKEGQLTIESRVPIMGETLEGGSGKPLMKQLGLVVMLQPVDQSFVDQLSRMTDTSINIFTPQGLSSGNLPDYQTPDQEGVGRSDLPAFNEIKVGAERYHQSLIPLYAGFDQVGTIAVLNSLGIVEKNSSQIIGILAMISFASFLLILPFAWYLANSISRPLVVLSQVFRGVASGRDTLSHELGVLEKRRGDELGDLTQSFIAMNDAVKQKITQIHEINATLEEKIDQRTRELRLANAELTKLASHDVLTGLPNRKLVSELLERALAAARRDKLHVGLMFIDLDEFKPVNDQYGHAMGDLLLIEAAKRIHGCIRDSDTVSRIGGDEFIILLPVIDAVQDACLVAEKIRQALNLPFEIKNKSLSITSSIGIAIYPEHGSDENTLLKNADDAMYDAKKNGRNRVKLFQTDFS